MFGFNPQFAETAQPSGIGALGLNVKSFIFQLITFLVVLVVLRRYVFSKLSDTLENRRQTLERSLEEAKQVEKALADAEAKASELIKKARASADETIAEAQRSAKEAAAQAETAGEQKAERIIAEAKEQLALEKERLSKELRAELTDLVVLATEKVIDKKMSSEDDLKLVKTVVEDLK